MHKSSTFCGSRLGFTSFGKCDQQRHVSRTLCVWISKSLPRAHRTIMVNTQPIMPYRHSTSLEQASEQSETSNVLTKVSSNQAFENTSTSVAASQMRNALNNLCDSVEDPSEKKVSNTEREWKQLSWSDNLSSVSRLRWTTSSLFSADI